MTAPPDPTSPRDDAGPLAVVRPAAAGDVPAIHAFIRPFVAGGRLLERTMDELATLVPTGFVAAVAGPGTARPDEPTRVAGFAALEIYSPKLAEIRSLAVAEAHRGRGTGQELVARCVELARERNVLEVMAVTSSDAFFLRCGFDFTLPGEKKALFLQTRDRPARPVEG